MLPIPQEIIKRATQGKHSQEATDDSPTTEPKQSQEATNNLTISKAAGGLKRTESLQPKSAKRQMEVEITPTVPKRGHKKDDGSA